MATVASDFDAFLEKTRSQQDEGIRWMTTFAEELRQLSQKHRDVCRDLERERIAGRHTQDETDRLEQEVRDLKESLNRGAHVQVIIEADSESYLFDKSYFLDDPFEGGKRAASDLRTRIQEDLKSSKPTIADLPIAIKAYANSERLKTLLIESGASGNGSALATFASGFSTTDDLTDFVCVGGEPEAMTEKILGNLSRALSSSYCKHVYIGAPAKDSYKDKVVYHTGASSSFTALDPRSGENPFSFLGYDSLSVDAVLQKTTQPAAIIESTPPSPALTTRSVTPAPTTRPTTPASTTRPFSPTSSTRPFSPVLTTRPVTPGSSARPATPGSTTRPTTPASTTRAATPGSTTRSFTPAKVTFDDTSSIADAYKADDESKEEPESDDVGGSETDTASNAHSRSSSLDSNNSDDSFSYIDEEGKSELGGNAVVVHRKALLPSFGSLDRDSIILNSDGHRLDSGLPPRSEAAAASLNQKTRSGKRRFCKMFHLYDSSSCDSSTCAYSHERLTQGEKMVMRHRLRGEKCHDRGRCRDSRCFYGHHCSCLRGTRNCPFPLEMHHLDDDNWTILKTGGGGASHGDKW